MQSFARERIRTVIIIERIGHMTHDDWASLFDRIPVTLHSSVNLVLVNGEVSVDQFVAFTPEFVALRGRVSGTTDEGRGFFIPYHQIVYARIEQDLKGSEIGAFFDGTPINTTPIPPPPPTEAEAEATANAAGKTNILEMIRTARAGGGKPPGK